MAGSGEVFGESMLGNGYWIVDDDNDDSINDDDDDDINDNDVND